MSRIRSAVPIFALSPHAATQARACLLRGVYPVPFDPTGHTASEVSRAAVDALVERGLLTAGDWLVLTKGDSYNASGGTNGMKLLQVGQPIL
ncbi:Pyruvate kinase II [compost metagenome]